MAVHAFARLMREQGLSAKPRKHRTRSTDSQHEQLVAPNLLNREFIATAPNTKGVADITAIWTAEGWLSLAVGLNIFLRMVVGWAMDAHPNEVLVDLAAHMALVRRYPDPGCCIILIAGVSIRLRTTGSCWRRTAAW